MKKKVISVIIAIILISIVFFFIDWYLVSQKQTPIFVIRFDTYKDGGTVEYLGLGYKVISFHLLNGYNEIKMGSWFMQYKDFEEEYSKLENFPLK